MSREQMQKMASLTSGWCGEAKIGAALEPPTLTQEGKNPSVREVQLRFPTDTTQSREWF